MWSLAVFALLLMSADAYSYQRPSYQVASVNLRPHYSNSHSNQQYKGYSPGHAYIEKSQYQFLHGAQLNNQYRAPINVGQQVINQYPAKSPGHAYYEKSQYEFLHGPQLAGNQINLSNQYGAPAVTQIQSHVLPPATHQHSPGGHAYIAESQYQFLRGPQLTANQYASPISQAQGPQLKNNQYGSTPAPGHAYVEKSQYQFLHGAQLNNNNNYHSGAYAPQHGNANQYQSNAPGHVYVEKSQYQFLHGDQLTNNEQNAVASHSYVAGYNVEHSGHGSHSAGYNRDHDSNTAGYNGDHHDHGSHSAGYNVDHDDHQSNHDHEHHTEVSYSIDVPANHNHEDKQESHDYQNLESNYIQKSVPAGDGNSILKPYQQTELTKANEQTIGFQSGQHIQPVVSKHIYFHVPPADIEEPLPQRHPQPLVKKNYKIIFIKVPSQSSDNSALIQQQLQTQLAASTETKTLIYVLVKKPEPQVISEPPPTEVSKPEVFYVKYKKNTQLGDIVTKISE